MTFDPHAPTLAAIAADHAEGSADQATTIARLGMLVAHQLGEARALDAAIVDDLLAARFALLFDARLGGIVSVRRDEVTDDPSRGYL